MNEITKYHNRMNAVSFTGFGKVDSNLFFALCAKMKNKGTSKEQFSFSEIRNLSGYKGTSVEAFVRDLEDSYKRILDLKIRVGDSKEFIIFNLFNYFEVSTEEQTIDIACNEYFEEILNDWTGEWTAFKLEEYVDLKSTYSKHMYRLLKQWRTVGGHTWKLTELRELLEVPDTYDMKRINDRVLKPIIKELPSYFQGLKIEKIKTGRRITALKFSFFQEDENYVDLPENEDLRSKQEKIDNIEKQVSENNGEYKSVAQASTHDNMKIEKEFMKKNDIPDIRKKKSLFSRFFGGKK